MNNSYDYVETDGNKKVTTTYTCEAANLQYTIIGEDIMADFDFIINDIPNKLKDMMSEISKASQINDAFYFENGGDAIVDIVDAYNELQNDVNLLNDGLIELREGFKTAIANVNAELASNFGYWAFTKPKVAGRTVEEIPVEE